VILRPGQVRHLDLGIGKGREEPHLDGLRARHPCTVARPTYVVNRLSVWPDFRDAWIVHDDPDILVVDKPEGVPSQAADPERADDVVTRLRRHLGGAYLGVHQRLDQATSGLLVFSRRREANASLAAQFEGRSVRKTYLAGVTGWPDGRERVVLRGSIEGKRAVTRAKLVARCGDRSLLELELETGRTHQARIQLAEAMAPIAGDGLYRGAPAPRLMLHASEVELTHPGTGSLMRFVRSPPPEFETWLARGDPGEGVFDDEGALDRALSRALERRWGLGRSDHGPRATTAFRLANEAGDGLPRLAIDVYGDWVVVHLYGDDGAWAAPARRERVLDKVHLLGFDGVYLKVRPRQPSVLTREADSRITALAPALPVRGAEAPSELAIQEEGVPLLARLGDGLSTGLFLDQRGNRQRIRAAAGGKSMANLFAYTCAFTVAAALGGARRTVSVDASLSALERGKSNLEHAGVHPSSAHTLVVDDVFNWMDRAARHGERFDLIVLDPPSYSTTKRSRFVAEDNYTALAAAAMALLSPGGRLLACSSHRAISPARFRRMLFDAGRKAKRAVKQVKDLPMPGDFPVAPGGVRHLKSAWVTLA
jgi:23S rRNA (cytosine1962-C5)-methyltransferase